MKKPEKKGNLFSLPALPTLMIVTVTVLLMVYVFSADNQGPLAYFTYLLSVYALIVGLSGFIRLTRRISAAFRNSRLMRALHKSEFGSRFLDDPLYRTEMYLYQGFFINMVYVFIKLVSGVYYHSVWFIALAFYYLILTLLRFSLLRYVRRTPVRSDIPAELRRYRLVGILLVPMTLALGGLVAMIVFRNAGYVYPGTLIYAMAAYTFYTVTVAIINVFKFRRHGSPVMSAAKVINLTAALVSMLALETAMITEFGDEAGNFRFIMTGVSGAVVCALVLGMASYMIIHATARLDAGNSQSPQSPNDEE